MPHRRERRALRIGAPRLALAHEDRRGAGLEQRPREGGRAVLPGVGDEHAAMFGVGGQLPQFGVVGHVGRPPLRQRHQHALTPPVEAVDEPHASAPRAIAVHVGHDRDPRVEADRSHPPRGLAAEVEIGRGVHRGLGDERACRIDVAPRQLRRKTGVAGVAGRILERVAGDAALQREARLGRGGGQAQRRAAARPRRQQRDRLHALRILLRRPRQRIGHAAPSRIAAPEQRPRS